MKIIVAPDKFKGSLSSMQACKSIAEGIKQAITGAEVLQFPMADGGDGFDEVLAYYLKTQKITCATFDPLMRPIEAAYQWQEQEKTAIISVAAASGLWLLKQDERNALATTTYGTGILIKHAIEKSANRIILGLGGSATNDAGTGILKALGFEMLDLNSNKLEPTGASLSTLAKISVPEKLPAIDFIIACDVKNVLFGLNGAAYMYAPQKGADEKAVKILDDGLRNIALLLKQQTGQSVQDIKGAGAAGGIAASLLSFFKCSMESGAGIVFNASGMETHLQDATLLITGEGKLDTQSRYGKVVYEVTQAAMRLGIPVIALCGKVEINREQINRYGLTSAYQIISNDVDEQMAVGDAAKFLKKLTAETIVLYTQHN